MEKQYIPHVVENGSRRHVTSYHGTYNGAYIRCSEPNCEINKQWDEHKASKSKTGG